jgi:hypothetical protein
MEAVTFHALNLTTAAYSLLQEGGGHSAAEGALHVDPGHVVTHSPQNGGHQMQQHGGGGGGGGHGHGDQIPSIR